jgi:hypothetical protein
MTIEKAFSIRGSASDVYAALLRDIGSASAYENELFEVLERQRDARIRLRVRIGFVPCLLTYNIAEGPDTTEVAAQLEPYGWKWLLFQLGTLGLRRQNMEMVLVQGLANLKAEVESTGFPPDELDPPTPRMSTR